MNISIPRSEENLDTQYKNKRIGILIKKLGPYHIARYKELQCHFDLTVIETEVNDCTYSWKGVEKGGIKKLHTIKKNDGYFSQIFFAYSFTRKLIKLNLDILIIPGWYGFSNNWALILTILFRKKSILLSDSNHYDFKRGKLKEYVKKIIASKYSGAIVGGKSAKNYLLSMDFKKPIFFGSNCIDNDYFANASHKAQLGTIKSEYFFVVSRLIKKKNIFFIIEAYEEYLKEVGNDFIPMFIAGDGELYKELEVYLKIQKLNDKVFLKGFIQYDELPRYYANARVFILASTSEQWGLAVNEAMACSLPILLSTKCGCGDDLLIDNVNGFLFNPRVLKSLSNRMVTMGLNDKKAKEMGRRSYEIVENYSITNFSDSVSNLLKLL